MATVTLHGSPVETIGKLPEIGSIAPNFTLTQTDLSDLTLASFANKTVILNIFPSIDTPTCALSVRYFNAKASSLENTVVICISADLPFALNRFCGAEGIKNISVASTFRSSFGADYGTRFSTGPLTGLLARSIIIIGADGRVLYTEQVPETGDEPNYEQALATL